MYKLNQAIKVSYRAVGGVTGIADLQFIPTTPAGVDQTAVNLVEVSGNAGLYSGSFTPNVVGRWWIRVKSITNPENIYAESYLIGYEESSAIVANDYYPKLLPDLLPGETSPLRVDPAGSLICRSAIVTDEGSFYEPFAGNIISDNWTKVTGVGQSISVADSNCTMVTGTTANSEMYITRLVDFSPLVLTGAFSISQRINNQDIYFGFSTLPIPNAPAKIRFHFFGTDDTKVCVESQSSIDTGGNQGMNTQVLIPKGMKTSQKLVYSIKFNGKKAEFYIGTEETDMNLIAIHTINLPDQYSVLHCRLRENNSDSVPSSSTNIIIDTIKVYNFNILDIDGTITGEVQIHQRAKLSGSNNSSTNLISSGVFTGIGESTLAGNSIQIMFIADQVCLIQIEQSSDNINWDISDSILTSAGIGIGRTIQVVSAYFRVLVINNGASTTTYFRLHSRLTPIVEALPRTLSNNGRLKVEATNIIIGASTNVVSWVGNNAPYKANMWLPVAAWSVPINYQFNPYQIQYGAGNSSSYVRATKRLLMGAFNNSTQVFTDGNSYSSPDFASYLNIYFTTDVGTSRVVTITYINQDGVAGRTTTYNMTSGSGGDKNGHIQRLILQGTDIGVRDITNITTNGTGTATFSIYGETDIFSDSADASGVVYTDTIPMDAFLVNYGYTISLQITSSSTAPVDRLINLTGIMRSML